MSHTRRLLHGSRPANSSALRYCIRQTPPPSKKKIIGHSPCFLGVNKPRSPDRRVINTSDMYFFKQILFSIMVYCTSQVAQWLRIRLPMQVLRRPRFDLWIGKIPWKKKWQPIAVFLPGKPHGQRSLVGYSPWGCKELDTTESVHPCTRHTHTHTHGLLQDIEYSSYPRTWFIHSLSAGPQFPIRPFLLPHLGKYKSILYVCEFVSVL